jgi:hypothetical protein
MKIAIKFGDNDFYNCFYGVLETIKNAIKWNDKVTTDREQLCKIINEISYGLYLLYQNSFEYNEEKSGDLHPRTKEYLKITPDQILINDEVVNYLSGIEWANSEVYVFDSDLDFENNTPIFSR